jgi:class 3 adenylate cyclase
LSAIANSSTRSQARRARRAALPDGTVTFLLTDIEGSTRLLARLGERYTKVLSDHQRLLRRAFADASGREIDTQGDAFLAVFNRAKDALAAALAGQRALVTHPWPDGVHVQVRMGLHTGEPAATRDRYIGLAVHRTAPRGFALPDTAGRSFCRARRTRSSPTTSCQTSPSRISASMD